jgi:uncharacterized protein YdgA (DUF945 family)
MSKAVIGVVGGVAVLAGAVVGGAAWSGQTAQRQIEASVAELQTQWPLKITDTRYEKGLFSSTHTVVLTSSCEGEESFSVTMRQRVQHGPLPGFTRIGWSVIDTELVMPESMRALLKDAPKEQALLTARTEVGLGGGFKTRVSTPVLNFNEVEGLLSQLSVQPLDMTLSGPSLSGDVMHYELTWPGLTGAGSSETADTQVKVGTLTARGDTKRIGKGVWVGSGKEQMDWQRLEVLGTPKDPGSKPTSVVFSDLKITSESTLDKDLVNAVSHLQAQAQINDIKISKIDMNGSLKRVHAPTYAQMLQQLWSPSLMCQSAADPSVLQEQAGQLTGALTALLPHNPEFSLDKMVVEIDGQPGELAYTLGTQGVTAEEAASPELRTVLFAKTYANGQVKLPVAWIEKLMVDKQPERQAQDKAMLDAMLGQAVDAGYVVRDGEMLNSQIKLDKGQLLVNGKPIGPQLAP